MTHESVRCADVHGMRHSYALVTTVLAVACIVAAGAVLYPKFVSQGSGGTRWQTSEMYGRVMQTAWDDERIVTGATCLGVDPAPRATSSAGGGSTRFVCRMQFTLRPSNVPQTSWNELASAMQARDVTRTFALLDVSPSATGAEVDAAAARWGLDGSRAVAEVIGANVISKTRWSATTPPISVDAFDTAASNLTQLLRAVPVVEAFKVDHGTYASITLAGLQAIDPTIPALKVSRASANEYCIQITDGTITWSEAGPGGAPTLGPCSTT